MEPRPVTAAISPTAASCAAAAGIFELPSPHPAFDF